MASLRKHHCPGMGRTGKPLLGQDDGKSTPWQQTEEQSKAPLGGGGRGGKEATLWLGLAERGLGQGHKGRQTGVHRGLDWQADVTTLPAAMGSHCLV